jgi:hypothetical protein
MLADAAEKSVIQEVLVPVSFLVYRKLFVIAKVFKYEYWQEATNVRGLKRRDPHKIIVHQ